MIDYIRIPIESYREMIKTLENEIRLLQEQCHHPKFEKGLSIVACVQPVMICTTCGVSKPMEYEEDQIIDSWTETNDHEL